MPFRISLVLISAFVFKTSTAQNYFSRVIPASELTANEKLPEGNQQNFSSTTYVREAGFSPSGDISIVLPGIGAMPVTFMRWYHYPNSFSYAGRPAGQPEGEVVFSRSGNRWHGMITTSELVKYIIQQTTDDVYAISVIDEMSYRSLDAENDLVIVEPDVAANPDICSATNFCVADPVIINIMVVYSTATRALWGGDAASVANITTAITNMNVANLNSGVNAAVQFNLAHAEEVAYTETGNPGTDLNSLRESDGIIDNVLTLRTVHQADLVSLIVAPPSSSCGVGFLNTNSTSYFPILGFTVVLAGCAVGNFTLAHELGHNMGLRHDRYVDASNTPCAHHHGYVNQAAFSSPTMNKRWRTILAYNDQCSDAGFYCDRVNNWANPAITRNGDPMGIPVGDPDAADEVYGINRFACAVASFQGLIVVPLKFISLTGNMIKDAIEVEWKTQNESNVSHYIVEVSSRVPGNFRTAFTVSANNRSLNTYRSSIPFPTGEDVFIRVKGIDRDGKITYSTVLHLRAAGDKGFTMEVVQNPVRDVLKVRLRELEQGETTLRIYSVNSKQVFQKTIFHQAGDSYREVQVASLTPGLYILQAIHNGKSETKKFIRH